MSSEDIKMLEFNRYQKSNKASFAFYADLEYLVEKIEVDKNALILKIRLQQKYMNIFHHVFNIYNIII